MADKKDIDLFEDTDGKEVDTAVKEEEEDSKKATPILVSATDDDDAKHEKTEEEIKAELMQIENLARIDPTIRETEEYKNLMSTVSKVKESDQKKSKEDDKDKETKEEKEDIKDEAGKEKQGKSEDDEDESDEKTDVFGITSGKKKAKHNVNVELPKEFTKYLKDNYSIEDTNKFLESVDTWRNQAQEGSKSKEEYDELLDGLNSLPIEIKNAINAFANAEDYVEAFTSVTARLDYDKPYDKQDKDTVVKHFYKSEYNKLEKELKEGDIDDDDYEDKVNFMFKTAERLFKEEKKQFEGKRAELVENETKRLKNVKSSANSSVDALAKKYPDFSNSELQSIKSRLVKEDIDSIFYKKDGTYNENAAEMLALALYGDDVIRKLTKRSKNKGISEANEKIVSRGKKKVETKSSGSKQSKEQMEAIQHLGGSFVSDPYV